MRKRQHVVESELHRRYVLYCTVIVKQFFLGKFAKGTDYRHLFCICILRSAVSLLQMIRKTVEWSPAKAKSDLHKEALHSFCRNVQDLPACCSPITTLPNPLYRQAVPTMTGAQNQPYFIEGREQELVTLQGTYKDFLVDNLEKLLIGTPTAVQWPSEIKAKIANTIVHGRLKYRNEDVKCCRMFDLETLSTGPAPDWQPLTFDADAEGDAQKSIVCEAMRAALGILLEENVFDISTTHYLDVSRAAADDRYAYEPDATYRLGTIATIVQDVFAHSPRPLWEVIDILSTAITGFPCIVDVDLMNSDRHFGAYSDYNRNASFWVNILVGFQARQIRDVIFNRNAKPGLRWKMCMRTKMAYVDKLRQQEGGLFASLEILRTLSKLDQAHIALEQGLAFKPRGQKICYVSPVLLTSCVMNVIADVYQDRARAEIFAESRAADAISWCLFEDDIKIMRETEKEEKFGRWISFPGVAFTKETLRNFVSREQEFRRRVATNKRGDCMFFVDECGPWKFADPSNSTTSRALICQTVHEYPKLGKLDGDPAPVEPAEPVLRFPFQPDEFKPSTLNAIINKPGRVLVKRKGVRGNWGRFIVVILVTVGIIAMLLNWAGRDNWLERIFDAVQLMSLGAAMFVAVIYVWTKTLTSTLDWLRGETEVYEDEQLEKCLGVSAEEVKIATTYEHESLFWLSDKNSSFCPGLQLGELVFSKPLSLGIESPHVMGSCVAETDRGFWILQGWAFRIDHGENAVRLMRIPSEDTVYVSSTDKRPEIS